MFRCNRLAMVTMFLALGFTSCRSWLGQSVHNLRWCCQGAGSYCCGWWEERATRSPARNYRRYTGLNLNSTTPPVTWSPNHIEKGETMLFLWKHHTGTAGLETGTHAWLARQSGALPIAPRLLLIVGDMPDMCYLNGKRSNGGPRLMVYVFV